MPDSETSPKPEPKSPTSTTEAETPLKPESEVPPDEDSPVSESENQSPDEQEVPRDARKEDRKGPGWR